MGNRFLLRTYKSRKPKGKPQSKAFPTPMAARQSKAAKEAVYYEIMDIIDKRIIEIKKEVEDGRSNSN